MRSRYIARSAVTDRRGSSYNPRCARSFRLRRWLSFVFSASLLLTVLCLCRQAPAQKSTPSQSDIQSIYLFDFAKFVRWPAGDSQQALTICVAGQKSYLDTLGKVIRGEHIETHPLAARAIQRPEDEAGCSILFIGVSERDRVDSLLAAIAGKPVLTVSDIPGFFDHGGMIQFLVIDKRVRFSVDLGPVERSGISLNSELLKVAVDVKGKPVNGGTQ